MYSLDTDHESVYVTSKSTKSYVYQLRSDIFLSETHIQNDANLNLSSSAGEYKQATKRHQVAVPYGTIIAA